MASESWISHLIHSTQVPFDPNVNVPMESEEQYQAGEANWLKKDKELRQGRRNKREG